MTDTSWASLRQLLTERYDDLRARLARRLGSADLASETLHETYLHLNRGVPLGHVHNPEAFLFRVATNIATDRRRREKRLAKQRDIRALLAVPDEAPNPAQLIETRQEIERLEAAIEELTARRRTILLWSRIEGLPLRKIAARLEISQRLVEIELKHALDHCAERVGQPVIKKFGPKPRETSK
ncbi:MAG: sigma-70 family RNA polymerase sigma factor [Pseudomonadota bacterium]